MKLHWKEKVFQVQLTLRNDWDLSITLEMYWDFFTTLKAWSFPCMSEATLEMHNPSIPVNVWPFFENIGGITFCLCKDASKEIMKPLSVVVWDFFCRRLNLCLEIIVSSWVFFFFHHLVHLQTKKISIWNPTGEQIVFNY